MVGDQRSFYRRLSGRENLVFFGALHGLRREQALAQSARLLELVDLAGRRRPSRPRIFLGYADEAVSGPGAARRSTSAATRRADPEHGSDGRGAVSRNGSLAGAGRRGAGILLATHDLSEASAISDRIIVLAAGRKVLEEPTARLDADRLEATSWKQCKKPQSDPRLTTDRALSRCSRHSCAATSRPISRAPGRLWVDSSSQCSWSWRSSSTLAGRRLSQHFPKGPAVQRRLLCLRRGRDRAARDRAGGALDLFRESCARSRPRGRFETLLATPPASPESSSSRPPTIIPCLRSLERTRSRHRCRLLRSRARHRSARPGRNDRGGGRLPWAVRLARGNGWGVHGRFKRATGLLGTHLPRARGAGGRLLPDRRRCRPRSRR